jgi:hypothetical protein
MDDEEIVSTRFAVECSDVLLAGRDSLPGPLAAPDDEIRLAEIVVGRRGFRLMDVELGNMTPIGIQPGLLYVSDIVCLTGPVLVDYDVG